jgi:hypothetical protein
MSNSLFTNAARQDLKSIFSMIENRVSLTVLVASKAINNENAAAQSQDFVLHLNL